MSKKGGIPRSRATMGSMSLNLDAEAESEPLIPRVPSMIRMGARTGMKEHAVNRITQIG